MYGGKMTAALNQAKQKGPSNPIAVEPITVANRIANTDLYSDCFK